MVKMKFAVFSDEGFPEAFYSPDLHGDKIPLEAIEITDGQWTELIDNTGRRKWVDGQIITVEPSTAPPTITDYENAIQNLVDGTARDRQFRDGVTLASYIGSTIPKWAAEAQAFVEWRDTVWQYVYQQLEQFQLGLREQPSVADFLTEIPVIDWNEQ